MRPVPTTTAPTTATTTATTTAPTAAPAPGCDSKLEDADFWGPVQGGVLLQFRYDFVILFFAFHLIFDLLFRQKVASQAESATCVMALSVLPRMH